MPLKLHAVLLLDFVWITCLSERIAYIVALIIMLRGSFLLFLSFLLAEHDMHFHIHFSTEVVKAFSLTGKRLCPV